MAKTRRKRKGIWKTPAFWSFIGAMMALGLILVCVFLFMDAVDSSKKMAQIVNVTEPTEAIPYSAEDFVLNDDGFMECVSTTFQTGIDVSFYQGDVDWEKVRDDGVEFVFIRVGGRGSSPAGELYADVKAQTYYEGAKAAGLDVGAYFYSQAISPEEAIEEAEFVLAQVENWELDKPIVFDWETTDKNGRNWNVNGTLMTQCALAFCRTIEEAGESPMIYFNESQGRDLYDLDQLDQYPFWLAKYSGKLDVRYRVDYWQYTETGKVDGIDHNVDLNIYIP